MVNRFKKVSCILLILKTPIISSFAHKSRGKGKRLYIQTLLLLGNDIDAVSKKGNFVSYPRDNLWQIIGQSGAYSPWCKQEVLLYFI